MDALDGYTNGKIKFVDEFDPDHPLRYGEMWYDGENEILYVGGGDEGEDLFRKYFGRSPIHLRLLLEIIPPLVLKVTIPKELTKKVKLTLGELETVHLGTVSIETKTPSVSIVLEEEDSLVLPISVQSEEVKCSIEITTI